MIFCKNTIFAFLLIGALCCCFARNSQHYNTMAPTIAWNNYSAINIQAENYIKNSSDAAQTNNAGKNIEKALNGLGENIEINIIGGALLMVGLVALIVAIPIIIYNIGEKMAYSDNPFIKNDFADSSGGRNPQKSTIQIEFAPSINSVNTGAGLSAILSF